MTLAQFEYIVALDNTRSFSKAAQVCFVTQPNLSMQVNKLEKELGVKLFERTSGKVEPTTHGNILIEKARNVMREVQSFRDHLKAEKDNIHGEFKIGIIPSLAPYLVPFFLPEFIKKYPGTKLIIEELKTGHIIDLLKADKLDVGLVVTPLEEKSIREIPVFHEPIYAYISRDHPLYEKQLISEPDLKGCNLWVLNEGHCFRNQALNLCSDAPNDPSKLFEYESGSLETLKSLVELSQGITVLPALAAYNNTDLNMIRKFEAPEPLREISLIIHENCVKDALLKALFDTIVDKVPDKFQIHYKNGRIINWR